MIKDFIILFVFLFLLSFCFWHIFAQSHEYAHQKTFNYAGIDANIEIGFFNAKTIPQEKINTDLSNLYLAHAIIESDSQIAIQLLVLNILVSSGIIFFL